MASIIIGILFICYSVLSLTGYVMNIDGIKSLYYEGWIKNYSEKARLVYYLSISAILLIFGVVLIVFQFEIHLPLSGISFKGYA